MKSIPWLALGLSVLLGCAGCQHAASPSLDLQQKFFSSLKNSSPEEDNALRRAQYHTLVGQYDQSLNVLAGAVASDPDNVRLLNAMGSCHDKLGQYGKAQEMYEKILARDHDNIPARNNLGYSYYLAGDFARAEKQFQAILSQNPEETVAINNLGLVWCRQGKEQQALRLWEKTDGEIQAREKLNQVLAYLGKSGDKPTNRAPQDQAKIAGQPEALPGKADKSEKKAGLPVRAQNSEKPVANRLSHPEIEDLEPAAVASKNLSGPPGKSPPKIPVQVEEVRMVIQPAAYSPPPADLKPVAQARTPTAGAGMATEPTNHGGPRPKGKEFLLDENLSQLEVEQPRNYRPRPWKRYWKPKIVTYVPPETVKPPQPIKNYLNRDSVYRHQSTSESQQAVY